VGKGLQPAIEEPEAGFQTPVKLERERTTNDIQAIR
jgi:hypothetical protein